MNKKFILRKNEEIQEVIKKSKKVINKYFVVYYVKNDKENNRYCISVSKKIGKAHTRNLYKRRIKDIISKNNFNNSTDYVIILRTAILDISYNLMRESLISLLGGTK
jgi:ribonuclease P protein component